MVQVERAGSGLAVLGRPAPMSDTAPAPVPEPFTAETVRDPRPGTAGRRAGRGPIPRGLAAMPAGPVPPRGPRTPDPAPVAG